MKNATVPKNMIISLHDITFFNIVALASRQLSQLMQYLTFGGLISPCINPASLSSDKCCDTVALAIGNTS